MLDENLIRLRELGALTGAPTWIPRFVLEIEGLQTRLAELERENEELTRQLAFYRRRVAA